MLTALHSGGLRSSAVFAGVVVAALSLGMSSALAQTGLDGTYRGGQGSYQMRVTVQGGSGEAVITATGCLGELSGQVAKQGGDQWTLSGEAYGSSCTLTMKRTGAQSFRVTQGPGCTFFHGAACSFETTIDKVD
ncbi:hypothetical protein EI983_01070 [Roseovarius faecimaris]|uniref:DUF3617 family protein n=1 Tax=Roseovarius faecimaris TaxID=2494550 RepID=A0A6I6IMD0_9RHOB|nr:hypothetical protein [Roseovarius faecimaris]QGX96943.1 hypothetical protein EI983_01070 [Roseovarius faecimaris]